MLHDGLGRTCDRTGGVKPTARERLSDPSGIKARKVINNLNHNNHLKTIVGFFKSQGMSYLPRGVGEWSKIRARNTPYPNFFASRSAFKWV